VQGLVAGVVGYAAVALFFLLLNVIAGQSPFFTAAALGSSLFYGLGDTAQLAIEPGPVLAFNGVHLLLSLVAGTIAAWLLFETERHHFIWYFVFFVFLAAFVYSLVVVGIVGAEILQVISWWSVLAANVIWVFALGSYLWFQHRGLMKSLDEEQESAT
jgi:hypothetical protein